MSFTTILILVLIGIFAGILSGMIGVGGGIIIVPALVYFLSLSQHTAQGTSLALMLPPIGILAAMNYYKAGALNIKYAIVIAIAFIIGGFIGSKLSITYINETMMKRIFGIVLFVAAIKMVFFSK